jgi:negative regulator of sigma E activity
MKTALLSLFLTASAFAAEISAGQVITELIHHDAERQAFLNGYTATRRYELMNKSRHASMVVRTVSQADGSKQFTIVEEAGSGAVRKHVFHKILDEEAEASHPRFRDRSRITPDNYTFELCGTDTLDGRHAYVIALTPKYESKYLIVGRIWVDADEYAVLRVEGRPAKSPSFWTKSVRFVHGYEKTGQFWFPVSNRSVTDARIFGRTDMTIEYFDYQPKVHVLSAAAGGAAR